MRLVLLTAPAVIEGFTYHREIVSADGRDAMLEFSGTVAGLAVKGVDLFRFDDAGRFSELEVMVRPLNGLRALKEAMAQALGESMLPFAARELSNRGRMPGTPV